MSEGSGSQMRTQRAPAPSRRSTSRARASRRATLRSRQPTSARALSVVLRCRAGPRLHVPNLSRDPGPGRRGSDPPSRRRTEVSPDLRDYAEQARAGKKRKPSVALDAVRQPTPSNAGPNSPALASEAACPDARRARRFVRKWPGSTRRSPGSCRRTTRREIRPIRRNRRPPAQRAARKQRDSRPRRGPSETSSTPDGAAGIRSRGPNGPLGVAHPRHDRPDRTTPGSRAIVPARAGAPARRPLPRGDVAAADARRRVVGHACSGARRTAPSRSSAISAPSTAFRPARRSCGSAPACRERCPV